MPAANVLKPTKLGHFFYTKNEREKNMDEAVLRAAKDLILFGRRELARTEEPGDMEAINAAAVWLTQKLREGN